MTVAYSGEQTTVDIPAAATDLGVELAGAEGGASIFQAGGSGGKIAGRLTGAAGSSLAVLIGEQGRQTLTNGTTAAVGGLRAAAILFHGGYTATFAGDAIYNKTSVFSRNVKVV